MNPDTSSLLSVLTRERLIELGRAAGVSVPAGARKERQVEVLVRAGGLDFAALLVALRRDELKAACRAFGLDDSGRARQPLAKRLLTARGEEGSAPRAIFEPQIEPGEVPRAGDVVRVRHRQYLVEEVVPPTAGARSGGPVAAHRVRLVGLDDDAQGRRLEVFWELELGARVLRQEADGLGQPEHLDPPSRFGAYLAALRWHSVTATEARLFQAPFRAGIKLMNHQLVPLERALRLPRANLFIADDVGLGKTIEAGLVLQELRLRQRVDFVLVICPASICLQWRDELWRRFGLYFEIMNRELVARRRQERGFGVIPWATHSRFIISHQLLRRPEYRDPLLAHLGERARKSLLILDEAHVAAPATATRYAVDSGITRVIRDVAPRFENRLFLSATPHNGHSNSFSALLELLDPQRFTRGVPVTAEQRDKVMVRRLKSDLKKLGGSQLPLRHVLRLELHHQDGGWHSLAFDSLLADQPPTRHPLGNGEPFEIDLARRLQTYAELAKPSRRAGRIALIRLQQRLLSSVEAFSRTLRLHAEHVARIAQSEAATHQLDLDSALAEDPAEVDSGTYGQDEEEIERQLDLRAAGAARHLSTSTEARRQLDEMVVLAERYRSTPDAKARELLRFIQQHLCPAASFGGVAEDAAAPDRRWADRRLIVFTEFAATLGFLQRLLSTAFEGSERGSERLAIFRGGMDDSHREALQRAFNGPPGDYPVRVLLATDAAREGVNLQGYCAHLFHYDVPWNPARLEQRNGRIDRTLQPAEDVYCHYFVYPQRPEDRLLDTLVRKVEVIQQEMGSLGTVILDQIESTLADGIDAHTAERLEEAEAAAGRRQVVLDELESQRQLRRLERQIDGAGKILNRSRETTGFRPELLRRVLDEALDLAGAEPLRPAGDGSYLLPELPESWQATVDTLRPPRERGQPQWEHRQQAPLPLVFEAPSRLRDDRVHMHLEHPLARRLLSRFLAQGFGSGDLSRVTALLDPQDARLHVVACARLTLFGRRASRLHDQLIQVAAVLAGTAAEEAAPELLEETAERRLVERLWRLLEERPSLDQLPERVRHRLLDRAAGTFAALWPRLREEADSLAHRAEGQLAARGKKEAAELRQLLQDQRRAIEKELQVQLAFEFTDAERAQRRQWQNDRQHMAERLQRIDREIADEPAELEDLYRVLKPRLEPVGLIYLWPASR